ncbi:uncharacterized protein VICG_01920 [Vittaforma corneae ATCC 50505]|uniref:DNA replication licensing factor MCM5 n=1 Tax=Vittaforma corneae (strain ATCC 50505) TaxID=993615 RepID=L2GJI7_VITCO|nr:uncharacterized protein VICG_01920 [Vittaforma corneae ATCC 50505]ELA41038.1 hypothetical protein VICG_01920 [Vittaforma corneae ATCC 50505]
MEYHASEIKSIDLIANDRVISEETLGKMFVEFVKEFKTTHKSYLNQLHTNLAQNIFSLNIQLEHIGLFNQELFNRLLANPESTIQVFEREACSHFQLKNFQILFSSAGNCTKIRNLSALKSNKIVKIQGIVVSASSIVTKPKELYVTCRSCLQSKMVRDIIPRSCDTSTKCPIDPYIIIPEKSVVSDVQYAKIQENFEDIPTGETPRHFSIILEGSLVNKISPGNQVKITGIYSIRSSEEKSFSFLKVLGVENSKSKIRTIFTEEEEALFKQMAKEDIYEKLARSIAPGIYGHEDVKKTLACMLFGGTRRVREDGITLRGDINVLLLGDPGVAKSQLLKFMESVTPIGVYTSGKGSSAAGLTASIIKDRNNEFYLEGGALVLADGGICCIDEFDKMNEQDRVAIHEAMEQQTISIAKAGITTVLNSRTAVLAAANPVFGRYDDFKTPSENIEFGTTILSRFDCIFIIKDKCGSEDRIMAEHVLNLHKQDSNGNNASGAIPVDVVRNYVQYAKSKVFPTLSEAASSKLNRFYVDIRKQVSGYEEKGAKKGTIPITVRQLEAIIRLSESLAKMELSSVVTTKHVDEAIRLFQASTMNAVAQGHIIEGMARPEYMSEIESIIEKIERSMPVGTTVRFHELLHSVNCSEALVRRAIDFMVKQNKLISKDFGKMLIRRP